MITVENFWKILTKDYKGLVEAACYKANKNFKICAQIPEAFSNIDDLIAHAYIALKDRGTIDAFNEERAGGPQNFRGYLYNRVEGILRNALQDGLRKKSVSLRGWETSEMMDKGESYPLYSPAAHCSLVVESQESRSSKDDEANDQSLVRGSQSKDWCSRCYWDVAEAKSPEETSAFMENILWELDHEEAKVAQHVERHGNVAKAAKALGIDTTKAHRLLKSARTRIEKLGVSHELMVKGMMV